MSGSQSLLEHYEMLWEARGEAFTTFYITDLNNNKRTLRWGLMFSVRV